MGDSGRAARLMFGAALRTQRTRNGMSLRDLGQAIHYDHTRLSRAEKGEHLPALHYAKSLDHVLGAGELFTTLRELADQAARERTVLPLGPVGPSDSDLEAVTVEVHLPDGRVMRVSISRRQFGELLTAGGFMGMLPVGLFNTDETDRLRRAVTTARQVDTQVVDYFRRLLDEHYTADKMLGPADLLPVAHAQMATLDRLRRDATPVVRRLLTPVQSQYAEFIGWLHQDAGDLPAALYYSDRATELAQVTGDKQMASFMLIRKSNIVYRSGDALRAVELAAAAQRDGDGVDRKILALAAQQEARGWAVARNYDHSEPKLQQATELLTAAESEHATEAPTYIHYYGLEILEEQTATCYRDMGRTEQAIAILQRKIDTLPSGHDRDRGYRMAKLAVAYCQAGHVQDAAILGLQALTLARQTGSGRTENELRPLRNALAAWSTQSDVATFLETLRTVPQQN